MNSIPTLLRSLTGWLRVSQDRKQVVNGEREPRFGPLPPPDPDLDPYQAEAAGRAIAAQDYLLVWGPPGAGKTRTIARIVRRTVEMGRRVLLCAFTNAAVDAMAQALLGDGQEDFLVVAQRARAHPDIDARSIQALAADPDTLRNRLRSSPVVLATAHSLVTGRYDRAFGATTEPFDLVIIDEASQLPEPLSLGVARLGRAFVLVGDHKQLPPVVSDPASRLGVSLFDRLWSEPAAVGARVMLSRQYRMRRALADYSNRQWYEGKLETAPKGEDRPPVVPPAPAHPGLWQKDRPLAAARVSQASHIPRVAAALVTEAVSAGILPAEVGVIAPNRDLVAATHHAVLDAGFSAVTVDTVDRYQGSEKDVIVLILHETGARGSLLDARRLNVALTRARRKLIVLLADGDDARNPAVAQYVAYLRENGLIAPV